MATTLPKHKIRIEVPRDSGKDTDVVRILADIVKRTSLVMRLSDLQGDISNRITRMVAQRTFQGPYDRDKDIRRRLRTCTYLRERETQVLLSRYSIGGGEVMAWRLVKSWDGVHEGW